MSDDYLWNRAGDEDPEIARLESLLKPLGHRSPPLDLAAVPVGRRLAPPKHWIRFAPYLAAAAVVLLVVGGSLWYTFTPRPSAWTVDDVAGAPVLGARAARQGASVPVARWLETDARSSLRLRADEFGQVEIGPSTRVRIVSSRAGHQRLALEHGLIHALIWSAPGQFTVDTPAATTVDLGCSYTLDVDRQGTGVLRVTTGWVGVEREGRESLVPRDAVCIMRRGRGPGTPRFEDVTRAFANALEQIDTREAGASSTALDALLAEARPRDAMSLWHLLSRVDRAARGRIFDRLAALSPPPAGLDRERVLAGERASLDAWWNSFGLGDVTLFRTWRMRESS